MFKIKLHPGENFISMHRQAEVVLTKTVFLVFLLIYLPMYFLIRAEILMDYKKFVILWALLVLLYFLRKYILWLLNTAVLTDQRLIKAEYHGLFSKSVTETPLERISNISFHSKGVVASLLSLGTVKVEVLGMEEPIELKHLKNPAEVKDQLWAAHKKAAHGSGFAAKSAVPNGR